MTPTFQAIANETLKPIAKRRLKDPARLSSILSEFHFFDVSAVREMAVDLGNQFTRRFPVGRLAFLPAEKTALDLGRFSWGRLGVMILQEEDLAICHAVATSDDGCMINHERFAIGLGQSASNTVQIERGAASQMGVEAAPRLAPIIYGALAIINTPRVIGRRQHMPHAGLQRRLAAARGMVGKFPLRAWTELVLEVTPPKEAAPDVHEARLTGGKCLHFCRAHLRIRNGSLEYVSPHWRGDPALGIKQTRYRLAA